MLVMALHGELLVLQNFVLPRQGNTHWTGGEILRNSYCLSGVWPRVLCTFCCIYLILFDFPIKLYILLFNICTHAANFLRGKDEVKFVTFETLSKKMNHVILFVGSSLKDRWLQINLCRRKWLIWQLRLVLCHQE